MKTKGILLILVILLSACDKLTFRYYTRINPDGSIYKRITAEGDSSDVYNQPFSFDVEDGWNISYDKSIDRENGDTLFIAIAEKIFESFNDVNIDLNLKEDSVYKDNIIVEARSRFLWFFTFHEYKETFKQRFPFKHLSVGDYLTDEEYAYLFMGDTACVQGLSKEELKVYDELSEGKFWEFLANSMGIEFVNLLNEYATMNRKQELSQDDSLFIMQLFVSSIDNGPEVEEICTLLDERLNTAWVSESFCNGHFEHFEKQISEEVILLDEGDYFAEVEVSGLLYTANASEIEGNAARWHFKRGSFLYKDYSLSIKYRTVNYWAFIVVGVIVFILVLSIFVKRRA